MSVVLPINAGLRKSGPYTATAGQTVFTVGFPFLSAGDLRVERMRASVLTTVGNFTASGEGNPAGGSITLTDASLADDVITIWGDAPIKRISSVASGGQFSSEAIDRDLDYLTIVAQETRSKIDGVADELTGIEDLIDSILAGVSDIPVLTSIGALRALTISFTGTVAQVLSWHAGLAKGGGLYVQTGSGGVDNGGTLIVDAASRNWVKQQAEYATPEDFGAKGDLTLGDDDGQAILNAIASGLQIVATRFYRIATNINLNSGRICFMGGGLAPITGVTITIGAGVALSHAAGLNLYNLSLGGKFSVTGTAHRALAGLKLSSYLTNPSYNNDQAAALRASLRDLFNLNYFSLDLEGRQVAIGSAIKILDEAGQPLATSALWKLIHNGQITPTATFPAATVSGANFTGLRTRGSEVLTGVNTLGLEIGMEVLPVTPGLFPRWLFITAIDVGAGEVTLNKKAISGAATLTNFAWKKHTFALDFMDMTGLSRVTFRDIHFYMFDRASAVRSSRNDDIIEYHACKFVDHVAYGYVQWTAAGGGAMFDGCDDIASDNAILPGARTRIGLHLNGDARIINCRFAYQRVSYVLASGASQITASHPFQGQAAATSLVSEIVYQQYGRHVLNAYVDNGAVEMTNELTAWAASVDDAPVGGVSCYGSTFTGYPNQRTYAFFVAAPYCALAPLKDIGCTAGAFRPLTSAGAVKPDRISRVDVTFGSIDPAKIENISFDDSNSFDNVSVIQRNPARAKATVSGGTQAVVSFKVAQGAIDAGGPVPLFDRPVFPFDLPAAYPLSVMVYGPNSLGAGLRVSGISGTDVTVKWDTAATVATDIIVEATCNTLNPLS